MGVGSSYVRTFVCVSVYKRVRICAYMYAYYMRAYRYI